LQAESESAARRELLLLAGWAVCFAESLLVYALLTCVKLESPTWPVPLPIGSISCRSLAMPLSPSSEKLLRPLLRLGPQPRLVGRFVGGRLPRPASQVTAD
jgi:hypothetical protein